MFVCERERVSEGEGGERAPGGGGGDHLILHDRLAMGISGVEFLPPSPALQQTSAYVNIRQHTSAYGIAGVEFLPPSPAQQLGLLDERASIESEQGRNKINKALTEA